MNKTIPALCIFLLAGIAGCKKDNKIEVDTEYPVIDISGSAFPKQCSVLSRGQKITFSAQFNDNAELGSFSLDIHHNFDQHSHSTELNDCGLGSVKVPVKPLLLIKTVDIPAGLKTYTAQLDFDIPADVDAGDYHFLIRLTDEEGWQTIKGLSIKIK